MVLSTLGTDAPAVAEAPDAPESHFQEILLRRAKLVLHFTRAPDGQGTQVERLKKKDVTVKLVISMADAEDAGFFSSYLAADGCNNKASGPSKMPVTVTVTDPGAVAKIVKRYAEANGTRDSIETHVDARLCERVTIDYGGKHAGAVSDRFAGWLKAGAFTITTKETELMASKPSKGKRNDEEERVVALRYFIQNGRNPKEVFSPADR